MSTSALPLGRTPISFHVQSNCYGTNLDRSGPWFRRILATQLEVFVVAFDQFDFRHGQKRGSSFLAQISTVEFRPKP